ncbi:hypothetical protein D0A35_10475 [Xanthomonas campestris]|nr:hypothetical protein D0A35_10475 [Xanthomonas campestris]
MAAWVPSRSLQGCTCGVRCGGGRASPATASLSRCSAKPLPELSATDASIGTLIGAARSGCAICD